LDEKTEEVTNRIQLWVVGRIQYPKDIGEVSTQIEIIK